MILCITLNPCLDKTLIVPPWQPGDNVRGTSVREAVGGKGNNVARALKRLGREEVRPVTFLGGFVGVHCETLLRRDDGFDPMAIATFAPTRVILTVRTGESADQSAFFDPDPEIKQSEVEELLSRIEQALSSGQVQALTLSGSSPSETTHSLYSDLISLARARRIPVFLDTYGPALTAIWGFWPDVIQLNRREAAVYLNTPRPTDDQIETLLDRWTRHGVSTAVVTDGSGPILARSHGRTYQILPPPIQPVNPIGSGDCFLAGLVDAWLARRDPEETLRHATACGVANALVWDAGAVEPSRVEQLAQQVKVILDP